MPSVRVPRTERIRRPQQCKGIKGFIASSSQGSCHIQYSGVEQEPRALDYSSIYKFRTKTGSWQGLIGCRGFLVFTDWPVIVPLIGQSYHLSDWPELPSLEAPEAWLRDYFWPSAPLWACHGSGEVVTQTVTYEAGLWAWRCERKTSDGLSRWDRTNGFKPLMWIKALLKPRNM